MVHIHRATGVTRMTCEEFERLECLNNDPTVSCVVIGPREHITLPSRTEGKILAMTNAYDAALALPCPYCGADPDILCIGMATDPTIERKPLHTERYHAAQKKKELENHIDRKNTP